MKVWRVFFDGSYRHFLFSTAEKAYQFILNEIDNDFDEDDNIEQIKANLKKEYEEYPSSFGVEDYAYAEMEIVDAYC